MNRTKLLFGKSLSEILNDFDSVLKNDVYPVANVIFGNNVGAINIDELEKSYNIYVNVPGFLKEEISIKLKENQLIVAGTKKDSDEKKLFAYKEFKHEPFTRYVNIPEDADKESIKAQYKNGVLEIVFLKKEKTKPEDDSKTINID